MDVSQCSHEVLRLFFEVAKSVKRPTNAYYHSEGYAKSVRDLSQRLRNAAPLSTDVTISGPVPDTTILELYRLAALVYLERASMNFSGVSDDISSLAESGFAIMRQANQCNAPLPLFVLGLEARSDEQRVTVLDVIENTMQTSSLKSLEGVRSMLQAAWTQDDFRAEQDLDYVTKLDVIMTANAAVPTFS